ncbi:ATP-binding protein [Nonomuraea sp. NPDC059194]|uniref:ATP-binding protein n=1 Tax=Nonomuraea sp. NPDC059194 TaxID=3346764 RepID=UPI003693DE10
MGSYQLPRPPAMFDREWEWKQLSRFVTNDAAGATLGIMSGRRRQGKTFLLQAACDATGGFYYGATEAVPRGEALRQLGAAVSAFLGTPGQLRFSDWAEAIDALLGLSRERAIPVVLDEFPYLAREAKDLPSVIQVALGPLRAEKLESRARLLLCGSSISFMGGLLMGSAPLRGRAGIELIVPPFDFRRMAEFWGISDYRLAALVYFILGGTPAYRTEFVSGTSPESLEDFDAWVVDHVLNPASPLFREVRALLAEDPNLRDMGLYHTVLAAVAEGNATRGGIASRIERKATDISHHLTVLQEAGLLVAAPDAFRANRSEYRITEPFVRFYHAIMRPFWAQFESVRPGRTERFWESLSKTRFLSSVAGPVFEEMCRVWAADMVADATLDGSPALVRSGVVTDPATRKSYEVDVVVSGMDGELLAIGEAKWGDVIGSGHLARLREIAGVLEKRGRRPGRLLLFSGTGFMPALRAEAAASGGEVQLVDLARLYEGE